MRCLRGCLTLATLLSACANTWAQSSSLTGRVVDPQGAIVAQATPSFTLSYRPVNDHSFLAEFLVVEEPTSVHREYLQFRHHRRPLTDAEVTLRVTGGVEQNIVLGWKGQHYRNRSNTTPGDVEEAETQPASTCPSPALLISRTTPPHFTRRTFAGEPHYLASNGLGETRIIPVRGELAPRSSRKRSWRWCGRQPATISRSCA